MRFIPSNCLRDGQKLASDLVLDKDRIMLRKGVVLSQGLIAKIRRMGFQGVYIDDDISKDIEVVNIISDELKYKARCEIKALFVHVEHNSRQKTASSMEVLSRSIAEMVDEVLYNRNVMVNVVGYPYL